MPALGAVLKPTEIDVKWRTGLKVLDRDDPEHIRKGTVWCHVGDRRYVVFKYSPTGKGDDGPWTNLAGREGYVQTDAANIFDRLAGP